MIIKTDKWNNDCSNIFLYLKLKLESPSLHLGNLGHFPSCFKSIRRPQHSLQAPLLLNSMQLFEVCNLSLLIFRTGLSRAWRMPSTGMLRFVALASTDVSEVRIASIIRVTRIGELATMLAVTNIRSTLRRNTMSSSETSVLTGATRPNFLVDGIIHKQEMFSLTRMELSFS
jgi:hypothetical protein